jgi:adenylate kinase
MFNIVLHGPPGCGKGTQSALIAEKYLLTHISTGDILRKEIELHTAIGEIVKKFVDRGYLVPDDIIMREIFTSSTSENGKKGLLFDGFPRTTFQAEYLDDILEHKNQKISLVINLEVDEDELFRRVHGRSSDSGRSDDNIEILKNRIEVYYKSTHPLIEYYKSQNKLHTVSGMAPVKEVFNRICSVIDKFYYN